MRPLLRRPLALLCVLLLVQTTSLPAAAGSPQQPSVEPAPQPPTASAPESFDTYVPFFKTNHGFSTTLFVRNAHLRTPATVTPVLPG